MKHLRRYFLYKFLKYAVLGSTLHFILLKFMKKIHSAYKVYEIDISVILYLIIGMPFILCSSFFS